MGSRSVILQSSQPVEWVIYIFVYILRNTKRIMTATIPAHGITVIFARLTGSRKFDVIPGGGSKAGIFDRSAPSGYNERSIKTYICRLEQISAPYHPRPLKKEIAWRELLLMGRKKGL